MIPQQVPHTAARPWRLSEQEPATRSNQALPANNPVNQQPETNNLATSDASDQSNVRSPLSQLNQFNGFLYFLLLCSIGLNIYLALISRGFYSRYRDLADELRDAFTTSI